MLWIGLGIGAVAGMAIGYFLGAACKRAGEADERLARAVLAMMEEDAIMRRACLEIDDKEVQYRARPEPRQSHPLGRIGGERGE